MPFINKPLSVNINRTIFLWRTCLIRAVHRRGFGVQSPSDYELVRDVLFEKLHYYAYDDLNLTSERDRQLWRICNHFPRVIIIREKGNAAQTHYEQAIASGENVLVIEHINNKNASMWHKIVADKRATITFDMRHRGLIIIDQKRIKQNYLL